MPQRGRRGRRPPWRRSRRRERRRSPRRLRRTSLRRLRRRSLRRPSRPTAAERRAGGGVDGEFFYRTIFTGLVAITLSSAFVVVTARNLVRSAFALLFTLGGVAGL